MFKNIQIQDWKHISRIEMDLHPRLTIITGANGSGKSTIIRMLAGHFGWSSHEFGTPARDENTGLISFYARKLLPSWLQKLGKSEKELGAKIGTITYLEGRKSDLTVPLGQSGLQYQISIPNQISVPGIFIPAHRLPFRYDPVTHYSTSPKTRQQAYSEIYQSTYSTVNGGSSTAAKTLKDTLLNWTFHGYGSQLMPANLKYKKLFDEFTEKIKTVLPLSIGFKRFEPRGSELVLVCESGEYSIEACSGGITALIELTWQIFTFETDGNYVVIIDEVENHLHPSMQRSILTSLLKAFPNTQFIVSTHSPFIVGSEKDSFVYALSFGSDFRVTSQKLELVDKAATASEILKQVLGVPLTIPIWAEDEISTILSQYENRDATGDVIRELAAQLRRNGLDHLVAASLEQFLDAKARR